MDVFSLVARLSLDSSEYESGLDKVKGFAAGVGNVIGTGMKVAGAAIGAATTAVGAFGGMAVKSYAEYEQLVGGVDKLYGDASGKLQQYADQAYKTSGMSANQYMETATSFSAALINSLGGDVDKAADITDVAMRAISDNVNVFGSDMESVQNAFQGFAKQNYTMLDNLKLGYGGTKEGMQQLIDDANEYRASIGQSADLTMDSFADIVQAIQSVQEAQNIAGTTNKEAMTTIEGSAAATKAAWENVITAIGRGEGLSEAFNGLVGSIFGEKDGEGLLNQIIPRIQGVMEGIGEFVTTAAPYITEKLPELVSAVLPGALESAVTLLGAIGQGIVESLPTIIDTIQQVGSTLLEFVWNGISTALPELYAKLPELISQVTDFIRENGTDFISAGLDMMTNFVDGILESLPEIIGAVTDLIVEMALALTDPTNLAQIVMTAGNIIMALANGLLEAIPKLLDAIPQILSNLVGAIVASLPEILAVGVQLLVALVTGIIQAIPRLIAAIPAIIVALVGGLVKGVSSITKVGRDMISGLWKGIKERWNGLVRDFKNLASGFINGVKRLFGIASPSKVFAEMGRYIDEGLALGITRNVNIVDDAMNDMSDIVSDTQFSPVVNVGSGAFDSSDSVLSAMANEQSTNRNLTVILELDKMQLGKAVYELNNEETQRVGVRLAGGYA